MSRRVPRPDNPRGYSVHTRSVWYYTQAYHRRADRTENARSVLQSPGRRRIRLEHTFVGFFFRIFLNFFLVHPPPKPAVYRVMRGKNAARKYSWKRPTVWIIYKYCARLNTGWWITTATSLHKCVSLIMQHGVRVRAPKAIDA
jgi:hypothetical protein